MLTSSVRSIEFVFGSDDAYFFFIVGSFTVGIDAVGKDFGDSTGSGLVSTAKQAAKEVVQAVVTKGAGIGGKGGGGISLSGEAKDMMAASKQLAGASAAPSREHLVAKPDLSR